MFPAVATGAHNPASLGPEPGLAAAVLAAESNPTLPASPPDPALDMGLMTAAIRLSRHMVEALGQCRRLGHRDPRVSLTRPRQLGETVRCLLAESGLDAAVAPAGLPGYVVLTLRG